MYNLYGPFDFFGNNDDDEDEDDDDEDEDDDEDDEDDDDDGLLGWNGHFGDDDGEEDYDDDFDDDYNNLKDDKASKNNQEEGEGDGFGEDIGDGYGDEQNPDGTEAKNPDDKKEKKKKKKKNKDADVEVDTKTARGGKKLARAIRRNATEFTTWGGMLAVGNRPIAVCPMCQRKSIYISKTATDILTFGIGGLILGRGYNFVLFCMNNYDECPYSYQNGMCFFSTTAKPGADIAVRKYPLALFRNCDKKSVRKRRR